MEQIVEYKNDPGNGYTKTLLCFLQLFIVSNRDRTYYFANNNARHFAFNAEERFLPIYEFADEDNKKITHLDAFAATFLKKCDLGRTISRYMVLIAERAKAHDHAALPGLCRAAHREVHRGGQRQRLHLAHHRQRQDAHLLQGLHAAQGQTTTSTNASSSWTAKTSTARPARSSTASRKAASRKTPTPPPSSVIVSRTTMQTKSSSRPLA